MQPDSNLEALAETNNEPVSKGEESTASGIPPGIRRSNEAFLRALPELLKNKKLYRRWVAYHGDERIGIARDPIDLYKECERRGIKRDEFRVCCIVPELAECDSTPFFPE